jgi:hypothetical protein
MTKALRRLIAAGFLASLAIATASAQEFQKSYRMTQGGSVEVHNVSGNITVSGYSGDEIRVLGYKEGPDSNLVEVEDTSSGNHIGLRAKYPDHCNCNASIRFELQVPGSISYSFDRLSTASGDIEISGVMGPVIAKTASGNVTIERVTGRVQAGSASGNLVIKEITGTVSARVASGNVDAQISRLDGTGDMEFSSASGDVTVRMPSNLDADVEMRSHSGSLETDFPITIKEIRYGSGRTASGRLGSGSRTLKISSASGNVTLKQI